MFIDPDLQRAVEEAGVYKSLTAGAVLMNVGDPIIHIPIVESGSLRIVAQDSEGHERFLYHIMPGESCAMSLTCCTSKRISAVMAIVEEDATLLMLPVRHVDEWMRFPEWRRYVSDTQAQRFGELLETIEVVAFRKLDEQLWDYLMKRVQATGNPMLKVTHQEIAVELNSPREVITRLMQQLRARGRVTLLRGSVEVHVTSELRSSEEGLQSGL